MGEQPRIDYRPSRRRRRRRHLPRIAVVLAAVLVMSLTGYAWGTMHGLVDGLTMADVIDSDGGEQPADGATDILLVGMDSRTDAQGNRLPKEVLRKLSAGSSGSEHNTDTLILLHIPNDGSKAVALSIPRDSYVPIPGFGKHKINSAYARARLAERKRLRSENVTDPAKLERLSSEQGATTLVDTIENLVGFTVDHYASINLLGFHSITKAVHGVKVCLNNPVDDPYSGAKFEAGVQTVAGADALAFVRQRHGLPRGDLDRIERQQAFMAGLARKILSAGTLTDTDKLSDLTDAIKNSVVLDAGWDIVSFAKRMRGLSGGQLEFYTIPVADTSYQTPSDGMAVRVDPRRVHEFVQHTGEQAQRAPGREKRDDKSRTNSNSPSRERVDPATITVNVRNGNGTPELASTVSGRLADEGYPRGTIGNTAARESTVVRVAGGERATGEQVAAALHGSDIPVHESQSLRPGHVTVLLGQNHPTRTRDASSPGAGRAGGGDTATNRSASDSPEPIDAQGIPCVN